MSLRGGRCHCIQDLGRMRFMKDGKDMHSRLIPLLQLRAVRAAHGTTASPYPATPRVAETQDRKTLYVLFLFPMIAYDAA